METELGLRLTPVEDTLADMAASLLKHGLALPAGADAAAKVAVGHASGEEGVAKA